MGRQEYHGQNGGYKYGIAMTGRVRGATRSDVVSEGRPAVAEALIATVKLDIVHLRGPLPQA